MYNNNLNQSLPVGLDVKLPIHTISTMDLYNLLQDISASKLIIDLRKKKDFDKLHIKTAVNIPPPLDDSQANLSIQEQDRIELKKFSIHKYISDNVTAKYWNLVFQRVIIYADTPFQYSIDDLNKLDYDTYSKDLNLLVGHWNRALIEYFVSKRKSTLVYVYQGGFETFNKRYPFMAYTLGQKIETELYPSEIIEGFLYLGGKESANSRKQLQNLKITYIVNMAKELNDIYSHIYKYYRADLDDHPKAIIIDHFEPIFKFLDEAKKNNERVLIHCAMGISRSATVVIAYLMKDYNYDYTTAYKFVKSKRSIISPNFGFARALKDYEKQLQLQRVNSNNNNNNTNIKPQNTLNSSSNTVSTNNVVNNETLLQTNTTNSDTVTVQSSL